MVFSIIIFIITLLILVLVHEAGHFLVAKKFNIKVLEFGFGIPPRVWGKKIGETIISLNWLPLGGFVRLLGEDEVDKKVLKDKRSFAAQGVWKRIAVVIAGVSMNLLLAWLIFYIVLGFQGFKVQYPLLTDHRFVGVSQTNDNLILVEDIVKDSPAAKAGLKAGERILAINGIEVNATQELIDKTKKLAGESVTLSVSDPKKEQVRTITVTPRKNPPAGEGPLGVALAGFELANLNYATLGQKLFAGPIHSWNLISYSGDIMGRLINRSVEERSFEPVSHSVAGPVGITSLANTILTSTANPILPYLDFTAMLALNLAVLNLLPFPALDGGRLFFLLIEAITRKKVKAEVERMVHTIGMVILLTLILLITFSDIRKLFP